MDKNTITGLILIAAVLIGYSYYSQSQMQQSQPAQEVVQETVAKEQPQQPRTPVTTVPDSTSLFYQAGKQSRDKVVLQNEKVAIVIDPKGGLISDVQLKEYKSYNDYKDDKANNLHLYSDKDASLNFVFETKDETINTADYYFTPVNATDSSVTMVLESESTGGRLEYDYRLSDAGYLVNFSVRTVGLQNKFSMKSKTFSIAWKDRVRQQEKGFYFENMYSTLTYKLTNGDAESLEKQVSETKPAEGPVDWVAFKNQYFSCILIAKQSFTDAAFESKQENEEAQTGYLKDYTAEMQAPFDPTGKQASEFQFYFGPNHYRLLNTMDDYKLGEKDNDLEELVDLGWPLFRWINRYFTIYVFDFLTQLNLPMGIVLLLITLLLRMIVYIPTRKSFMSSAKMRVLKPKVDEISKKYPKKEDAMRRQQEMMSLYSQYGVSPMGGCLPMLIQMPIWIAMFNFVPNAIELRQQSFLWADDLSTYDDIVSWSFHIPWLGNHLSLFCLLFCATNVLYSVMTMRQQRESMSGEQAQQMKMMQWMMYLMPVFFFFMFNKYSSGLNYYYFISLLASALTMWYLRRTTDDKKLLEKLEANYRANKNNPNKKPSGLAARLEALQKQQEAMLETQRKRKG